MNLKQILIRTGVLILVLVGLGLYFYFFEVKGGKEREEAEEEAKKVFQLDKEEVVEFRLARADEEEIVCTKKEDTWRIDQPVEADADQDAVNRVVSEFVDAKRTRTVEEEPEDLSLYGLDEPSLKLAVALKEKEESPTLLFGKENPTNTAFYAKTEAEQPVFLVQRFVKTSMDKKLYDLRNKKVADVKKDEVQTLQLARGELTLEAEKQDDETWMLTSPLKTRGDKTEIDKLINKMNSARIKEFINEDPQDLSQYGLDEPEIKLTMLIGEDKASKGLLIGRKNEDKNGYYAKRAETKNVFLLEENFLEPIPETVDTWRDHSLVTVGASDVEKMEYTADDQKVVLARNEDRNWELLEPIKEPADNMETNDLIADLTNIKATEFMDEEKEEFGLADPQVAVKLWKKDVEQPITVAIGAKNEAGDLIYARNMDGTPVTINASDLDKAKKSLFDFRDKVLVTFDKRDVEKLSVRYGDNELVVAQQDETWRAEKPERFTIGNQGDIDSLVWAINYLKMEEIVEGEKPEDLSTYGLDKPRAEFTVALADEKSIGPFLVGNSKDGNVYVMTAEKPGVYLIKDSMLDDMKRELGDILDKSLPEPEDLLKPKEEPPQ
jgi:hypothetical protein